MQEVVVLLLAVAAAAVIGAATAYNGLVALRGDVRAAWGAMDEQLRRRADRLAPLVSAARSTGVPTPALAAATAARNRAAVAFNQDQLSEAERDLSAHLRQLFADPPPSLSAHPAYARCQSDLSAAEAAIVTAASRYDDAVAAYNAAIDGFPTRWAAVAFGFKRQQPFGVTPSA